jgi:hypothetical protein
MTTRSIACAAALAAACVIVVVTISDAPAQEKLFSDDRLDQLVAPIALDPDPVVAQVLMAATYPLEVVEAARWMQAHPGLNGAKLEEALRDQDWDASVKSLCGFPDLLQRMDDDLGWLRDLGDASLSQRADVMDAVQRMRRRALDAGHLKTSPEMTVTETVDRIVIIEPPATEVVYVPTWYCCGVYGPWSPWWWWYPVYFAPPPPAGPVFFFGVGVPWRFGMWGSCDWGWHRSMVEVNVVAHDRFVQRTFVDPRAALLRANAATAATVAWKHDPLHRRGATYRNAAVAQRFQSPNARPAPPGRDEIRGRTTPPPRDPPRDPPRGKPPKHEPIDPRGKKDRGGHEA